MAKEIKTLFTIDKGYAWDQTQYITRLLAHAENLERVSTTFHESQHYTGSFDILDWNALSMLALKVGPRLVDLDISLHRPTQHKSPDLFYQFPALKHLGFSSSCKFDLERSKVDRGAFKALESLTCSSINNTFLSFMSCLECVTFFPCGTSALTPLYNQVFRTSGTLTSLSLINPKGPLLSYENTAQSCTPSNSGSCQESVSSTYAQT